MHVAEPSHTAVPAVALELLALAKAGRLVVCVGAGLSMAQDARLPSGTRLGELLDQRLQGRLRGYQSPANPGDLIAVADNAVALVNGVRALQAEVLELAYFTTATPNYGHQALALLLAEGALTALSWNWDTCIERSLGRGEDLTVARTAEDIDNMVQPHLAKVHGCATNPHTMLITSEELDKPPVWTEKTFASRIYGSVMLFIGIGDVADYARRRIEQVLAEFTPPDVRVVTPNIMNGWEASKWAEIMPTLAPEKRIEAYADNFLDELARAWVRDLGERLRIDVAGRSDEIQVGASRVIDAIEEMNSVLLLRWCRASIDHPKTGESSVHAPHTGDALLAMAVLASESTAEIRAPRPACCVIGDEVFELFVLKDRANAEDIKREARRRAAELASRDNVRDGTVRFLLAGTVVGSLDSDTDSFDVLAGAPDCADIVDGPHSSNVSYLQASAVLARAA